MKNYTIIWKYLSEGTNVLLLIRDPDQATYDVALSSVVSWFDTPVYELDGSSIVKGLYGTSDYLMLNDTWLCIRKASSYPPTAVIDNAVRGNDKLKVIVI